MNVPPIQKLNELLELPEGSTILDCKSKRLTAPGENYGSLMLSVDITVKTSSGTDEISTVAKLIPPNDFIQQVFNTQVTFRNEIAFYKKIIPLLRNFQREHGSETVIDFFPQFYGGRINLQDDENSKVDSDAILLLENLKVANYINLDRLTGLDLDATKLVVIDLAQFHAVPLALKLEKPEVFEKKVKIYLKALSPNEKMQQGFLKGLKRLLADIPELQPLTERIVEGFVREPENTSSREPWNTIVHNDCWVNNTMMKLDNGKPIKNKIVDFQACDYASPARDLVFFLFSSVKSDILEKNYDHLVRLYHDTFIKVLTELGCNATPFSYAEFCREIDLEARYSEFRHVVFMLNPIFAAPGSIKDFDELNFDDTMQKPTSQHIEKFKFVVREFIKRNWI